jgi:hypothetical protein
MKRNAMNPLCPCRKTGAWSRKEDAEAALAKMKPDGTRLYMPVGVDLCPHNVWHLTSKSGKRWRSGKRNRQRRTR